MENKTDYAASLANLVNFLFGRLDIHFIYNEMNV